jgi:exopolysaccharide production protein ExoQ
MATISYKGGLTPQFAQDETCRELHATSIWQEVSAWLALLPVLFITVIGSIQTDSGPVAFRFTAMDDDSPARKAMRLACSILMLLIISTRSRDTVAACKRSKLLLFMPALAFVSVLWSQNPRHTIVDALNLLLTTVFALYIYLCYPGSRLLSFLGFATFVSLLLCVLSVTVFPNVGIDVFQQDAWRGIFNQRNNCATACVLFLTVGLHWPARGIVDKCARTLIVFLSLLFIVMSGSRTGWLLTALALVLTVGLKVVARMASRERILFIMLMTVPSLFLAFLIMTNSTQILAALDKDPTLSQRTIIWAQVIPSIVKHPLFGYGYSSFWTGLNGESMQTVLTTGWMEGQAQDGYLDVLLELGFLGLIPIAIAFIRGFGQSIAAVEHRNLSANVQLAIVLIPIILVGNIGESSLLTPLGIPWFYALIALSTLGLQGRFAGNS